MKNYIKKHKKKIIIFSILILILAGAGSFYYFLNKNKSSDKVNNSSKTTTSSKSNSSSTELTSGQVSNNSTSSEAVSYTISDLNKSDGSVFSIPDELKFSISPNVDKVNVSIVLDDGTNVYSKDETSSLIDLTIYPEKKIAEGTKGKIIITGFVDNKDVITKTVGIVF